MTVAADNLGFVECWNEILTPKWIRFRHLLSGNGSSTWAIMARKPS